MNVKKSRFLLDSKYSDTDVIRYSFSSEVMFGYMGSVNITSAIFSVIGKESFFVPNVFMYNEVR